MKFDQIIHVQNLCCIVYKMYQIFTFRFRHTLDRAGFEPATSRFQQDALPLSYRSNLQSKNRVASFSSLPAKLKTLHYRNPLSRYKVTIMRRVIFYIRHFNNCSTLHCNALAACVSRSALGSKKEKLGHQQTICRINFIIIIIRNMRNHA